MTGRAATIGVGLLAAFAVSAASVPISVVGSGGARATGATFAITGTLGQAAAGIGAGPETTSLGGFWYAVSTDDSTPIEPWQPPAGPLIPRAFALGQNTPNPFNPRTTIRFAIPAAAHATLRVHDLGGRLVSVLVDDALDAGYYQVTFEGRGIASGVYVYRLRAGSFDESRKLLLLK